jgi:hypothetical protein
MTKLESTARELVRELPKTVGKTGDPSVDYQVSDLITVLATDLRFGRISRGDSIVAKLDVLQNSLSEWGGNRGTAPRDLGRCRARLGLG